MMRNDLSIYDTANNKSYIEPDTLVCALGVLKLLTAEKLRSLASRNSKSRSPLEEFTQHQRRQPYSVTSRLAPQQNPHSPNV